MHIVFCNKVVPKAKVAQSRKKMWWVATRIPTARFVLYSTFNEHWKAPKTWKIFGNTNELESLERILTMSRLERANAYARLFCMVTVI